MSVLLWRCQYPGAMHKIFLCFFTFFASCQANAAAPAPGIAITAGSGVFDMRGGIGHEDDTIRVHYYKPRNFTARSRVLIVLPGAGRNGDEYRDSWIATADRHGILVLAPSYAEKDYGLGDYHFGGIIHDIELRNVRIDPGTEIYRLNDEDIHFGVESRLSTCRCRSGCAARRSRSATSTPPSPRGSSCWSASSTTSTKPAAYTCALRWRTNRE